MDLPKNRFKHALAAGERQTGLWCSTASAYVAELLAGAGFDWILLDTEHAPNDPVTVLPLLQAVAPYPVTPIVRPASNDTVLIKRLLDVGVQSLLIPYVESAKEARAAVDAMRYPPEGVRGVAGLNRATGFGRIKDYMHRAHEELCCLVQVETRRALDAIEEIAAVDGVDGIFIGPNDLAASLGMRGRAGSEEMRAEIATALKRIEAAGKPSGILASDDATAEAYLALGSKFTAVGSDITLLARAADALAAKFRAG